MENIQMLLKQGAVGKPCAPVVAVGDKVKRGQLIATPTGLGVNVHSSVSGEVIEITDDRIIIKPDDEQSEDYVKIAKGSNLEMIKEAGSRSRIHSRKCFRVRAWPCSQHPADR